MNIKFVGILIIVVIVIVIFLIFKSSSNQGHGTDELFGDIEMHIEDMLQIQDLYKLTSLENFRTYNPCVFTIEGFNKPFYSYRMSNFTMCVNRKLMKWDKHNKEKVESHTFICAPNKEIFKITHEDTAQPKCVRGCEDSRTIVNKNKLYITCNSSSATKCRREMVVMEFDLKEFTEPASNFHPIFENERRLVREVEPLSMTTLKIDFDNHRDQKNWMPFFIEDELHFVYSINPHVILKKVGDECIKVAETSHDNLPNNLRGGSQIIPVTKWNVKSPPPIYKNGMMIQENLAYNEEEKLFLGVIHIRESHHKYVTYLYAFDRNPPFNVKYITEPFVFSENGDHKKRVQFASGLAKVAEHSTTKTGHHSLDSYLYITYGQDDCDSKLCRIKEEVVMKVLIPVDKLIQIEI